MMAGLHPQVRLGVSISNQWGFPKPSVHLMVPLEGCSSHPKMFI